MKKTFTLIELLIVAVIICILLLIMIFLGTNYIYEMEVRNDKEEIISFFNKAVSQSLSSSFYYGQKYDKIQITLKNNTDKLYLSALDEDWNKTDISYKDLKYVMFTWINDTWKFLLTWNTFGCQYTDNSWTKIAPQFVDFAIYASTYRYTYCFKVDLSSCRIFEQRCYQY